MLKEGKKFYEEVILRSQRWAGPDQMMFVVGATHASKISSIRKLAPEYFFLVPGIGSQGGDLEMVSRSGLNKTCGLLVNSARAIIYASGSKDFAAQASNEARKIQQEMNRYLDTYL